MRNMFGVRCRNIGCNGDSYVAFVTYAALLLYLTRVNNGIKISSITVPRRVDNSTSDPARLNCFIEYDQPSDAYIHDLELVIKWQLNNSTLLYQWVYNGSSFVNKNFVDYIDTRHEVPTNTKPTSMPLTFVRKSVDLTGQYTCLVTTFTSDDSKNAQLQVYVPVDDINLNITNDNETNDVNITCKAGGIFPRPSLELTTNKNISLELIEMSIVQEDYLYDVSATYQTSLDEPSSTTIFNCTVSLPAANISHSKTYLYKQSGYEISDYSVTSEYTNNTSSSPTDDNGAGSSHQRSRNMLLLILFVIFIL